MRFSCMTFDPAVRDHVRTLLGDVNSVPRQFEMIAAFVMSWRLGNSRTRYLTAAQPRMAAKDFPQPPDVPANVRRDVRVLS